MSTIFLLSNCDPNTIPDSGYIIIGRTLYEAKDGYISKSWQLTGYLPKQLEKSARKQANLHGNTPIYVDDDEVFDTDKIAKTGQLCYIKHDGARKDGFCGAARLVRGV